MKDNFKAPKHKTSPLIKATMPPATSTDNEPPVFSFENMQDSTGHSVNCCGTKERSELLKRMFKLSAMTWLAIRQAPKHGLGAEKIARSAIKKPLPPCVTEDTTLLVLRYHVKKPVIGYRDGRLFHVLLVDHDFSCYKH